MNTDNYFPTGLTGTELANLFTFFMSVFQPNSTRWSVLTQKRHFRISFPRENEAGKHDLVELKVQCLKVSCCHGNKSTILLFDTILEQLLKFLVNITLLKLV